jgi:Holliday junction resolvasome RuvABC DNA-binding subunit
MKKETIKEWLSQYVKEGQIDLEKVDFENLNEQFNKEYNDGVKAEKEKASQSTRQEVLKSLGFENEEALKEQLNKVEELEKTKDDQVKQLEKQLEEATGKLTETEKSIKRQEQVKALKELGIKESHLEKAHKLISLDLEDEDKFEDAAKQFVEETPEWMDKKSSVQLGANEGGGEDDKKTEVDAMGSAWD